MGVQDRDAQVEAFHMPTTGVAEDGRGARQKSLEDEQLPTAAEVEPRRRRGLGRVSRACLKAPGVA